MKFLKTQIIGVPVWQLFVAVLAISTLLGFASRDGVLPPKRLAIDTEALAEAVIPEDGFVAPVRWGDLGKRLVENGAIDPEKFEKIYASGEGLTEAQNQLLYGYSDGNLRIDRDNAHIVLNLLWAFGLANQNTILTEGPMADSQYGGYEGFASTGGWTLAKGSVGDHYSRHALVTLTPKEQSLVERVAQGIYRPCCNNSTYFPDCNHGMAMLGLLELMAAQGVDEDQMYAAALKVNSYWFPDTYLTIARYFEDRGTSWEDVDPKEVLGFDYSSASGFSRVLAEVEPVSGGGGGSCGV